MKRLFRKMFRDMWKEKTQFIAIFIMCLLGILIYSGIEGVWNGMQIQGDRYFKDTNLADVWVNGYGFDKDDIKKIEKIDTVKDGQLSAVINAYTDADQKGSIRLIVNEKNSISKLQEIKGEKYAEQKDGIWLDADFAKTVGISVDDKVEIYFKNQKYEIAVKGLVYSPEYIYYTGTTSSLLPNHKKYTYGFISPQTMKNICGDINYNQVKLKVKNDYDDAKLKSDLQSILSTKYVSGIDRTEFTGVANYTNKIQQIKKMSIMFSVVFFLLALLTMTTTMKRIVKKQRTQIGILKALGFYDYQIKLHYAIYGLITSILGAMIGFFAAPYTVTPVLLNLQKKFYSMPRWEAQLSGISSILLIIVVLVCTLTAYIVCNKIVKELPAISLRDETSEQGKKLMIESIPPLWNRLEFGWKWSLREMFQNKTRTVIGITGVLGSMMLLMASFGIKDSINEVNKNIYGKQFSYYEKMKLQGVFSEEDKNKIEKVLQGKYQWLYESTAEIQTHHLSKTENIMILDSGYYTSLYDSNEEIVKLPEKGVVLSKQAADEMNVKKNEFINVYIGNETYPMCIEKIIDIASPQGIFVSKKSWEAAGGTFLPNAVLAGDSSDIEEVAGMECIGERVTLDKQLKDANAVLDSVQMVIILLLLAAIMLSIVVLYNLGMLSYAERCREYATLRVLGFYNAEVKKLILKDNIINVVIGWGLGIPMGYIFLNMYVKAVSISGVEYMPYLKSSSLFLSSAITIGCSLLVNYIVSRKVSRLDMVESLKSVE